MNRNLTAFASLSGLFLVLAACGSASAQLPSLIVDPDRQPDEIIELWPGGAPGGEDVDLVEVREERSNAYGLTDHSVTDIVAPALSVFRAAEPDGSAILIAPGGGYSRIVVEHEGWETARWFARRGTTAYVMTYRLPQQGWAAGPDTPLQDAQRAMRLVRSRAGQDGFDPGRIAVLGFSAGGHVAGSVAQRFDAPVYEPVDAADSLSARPDAAVLVYPVATMLEPAVHMGSRQNLIGADPSHESLAKYSLETSVPEDAPPTLLIHAADDRAVPPENSIALHSVLTEAGVPAALHIFDSGGHGFGMRIPDDRPRAAWPGLVVDFGRSHGVFSDRVSLSPVNGAVGVNPDVQLKLQFEEPPVIGSDGEIRVYDAADDRLIDTLDLAIPPGPTARREGAADAWYLDFPYPYDELPRGRTNANTDPGTPTAGATPPPDRYQLTIIGGFTDGFHFYPVIVDGNTAIVQLHHNLLEYGHRYYVEMDPGVLSVGGRDFAGFSGTRNWVFETSPAPPAQGTSHITVAADGSGDFNTVQGALDWVPIDRDEDADRITIEVKAGEYHEIVYFRQKHNITIRGEAPGDVKITYHNHETFNPHPDNLRTNEAPGTFPSRRAAFAADNVTGLRLENLVLETTAYGQAEGLLLTGERNVLDHVEVIGSGDALQVNGSVYIVDSTITGDGDTILGRGPAYFERCTINSGGVMMWIRNTDANHGNVFNDCTFRGTGRAPTTLARSPQNNVSTYPYAEAVLLNATLINIAPEGWGPADDGPDVRFWEFNSRDADGNPVDVSRRAPWSRQLDAEDDAEQIRNYGDPAWVLGGWEPRD